MLIKLSALPTILTLATTFLSLLLMQLIFLSLGIYASVSLPQILTTISANMYKSLKIKRNIANCLSQMSLFSKLILWDILKINTP